MNDPAEGGSAPREPDPSAPASAPPAAGKSGPPGPDRVAGSTSPVASSPGRAPRAAPAAPARPAPARTGDLIDPGTARRAEVLSRSWQTRGATKVVGDVDVERFLIAEDILSVGGRLVAGALRSEVELEVGGDLRVSGVAELRGTTRIGGSLEAGELRAEGRLHVAGAFAVSQLAQWTGRLELEHGLHAGTVRFRGGFQVRDELDAHEVTGELTEPSVAKTLRASRLRLRTVGRFRGPVPSFMVDRIEAVEARIEGVDCEYARVERLIVGPNCHLTRVDGTVVRRHRSSSLGPRSHSPPPHGLSR